MNGHLTDVRNKIFDEGRNPKLCSGDIERLREWVSQVNASEEKHLTYEGIDELIELAERVQKRFPSLLPEQFDEDMYKVRACSNGREALAFTSERNQFKFTDSQRTLKSFESFAAGLFGRNNLSKVSHLPPTKKDPILRFYKLCSKWKENVNENPVTLHEPNQWLLGEKMSNLLLELRDKLDLDTLTIGGETLFFINLPFIE